MMKRFYFVFILSISMLLPTAAFGQAKVTITKAERAMVETITADQLSSWLHFIASDAMGGRDTPSQGLDVTAEFLKMNLARWGFKPGGDNGTFFQTMHISRNAIDPANSSLDINGTKFKLGEGFYPIPGTSGDITNAPIVFAKSGWVIRSKNINDFDGIDVKGKVVALQASGRPGRQGIIALPDGVTQADLSGERGKDWSDGMSYAAANGAVGVIILPSEFFIENWGSLGSQFGRGSASVENLNDGAERSGRGPQIPGFFLSEAAAKELGAAEAGDLNKTITIKVSSKKERTPTQNVVAIWEGSGPLKHEYVAVGSHYDHDGIRPNAPGEDKIWNGADDDGSGTVAMLAIAEAFAKTKQRPKRSILFVWHAGEEKGLWGSAYFNKFPTVDIKNIVTQINIDMIGRSKMAGDTNPKNAELSGPNEVYVIGSNMMSTTLDQVTHATNDAYLKMEYNPKYNDPNDPNRFFFRSDHFNYAMKGIPVVFWFTGVHEDYHQASDTADKIDYAKMEKITRTIMMTLWEVSELSARPVVDKQLPPELMQR